MAFKLPSEVESPNQLLGCRLEAEGYSVWLRDAAARQKVKVAGKAEPSLSEVTLAVIKAWQGAKPVTVDSLDALVAELTNWQAPVLHLSLAAVAPPALRQQLVAWVRTNCQAEALVNFVSDSSIGGGVIIRTPDHIYDYSFRAKLMAGRAGLAKGIANVR
jgi:hypothetical protein